MSKEKSVKVTILKKSFGDYSNATPIGKTTVVPESVAKKMIETEHAKLSK